jgi:hypothetical protein
MEESFFSRSCEVRYVVIGMSRNSGLRVFVPSKHNTPYFKLSEMEFSRLFLY